MMENIAKQIGKDTLPKNMNDMNEVVSSMEDKREQLQQELKNEINKTNEKLDLLEQIELDIVQEVVRPEKVINPKKIIERYIRDVLISSSDDKDPDAPDGDPYRKPSKYKYVHEDIIESKNQSISKYKMKENNEEENKTQQKNTQQNDKNERKSRNNDEQNSDQQNQSQQDSFEQSENEQNQYSESQQQENAQQQTDFERQQQDNRYVQSVLNSIDLQKQKTFQQSFQQQTI